MDKEKTISQMTLEEKAEMLTGKDFWSTKDFSNLGIRSLFLSDGPHGLRKQAAASDHLGLNASIPATCFPTASVMACSWDEELGERIGEALGEEAAALNVDVLLGPGLNIKRNPLCGRNFSGNLLRRGRVDHSDKEGRILPHHGKQERPVEVEGKLRQLLWSSPRRLACIVGVGRRLAALFID